MINYSKLHGMQYAPHLIYYQPFGTKIKWWMRVANEQNLNDPYIRKSTECHHHNLMLGAEGLTTLQPIIWFGFCNHSQFPVIYNFSIHIQPQFMLL